MIRPAAFCGVYGYKPSSGLISRHGVLAQSRPLDTVGVMAGTLEDLALLAEPLMAYDARDPAMRPQARPDLLRLVGAAPPVPPRLAFVRTPVWAAAEAGSRAAFAGLVERLAEHAAERPPPPVFDDAIERHRIIVEADLAKNYAVEYARGADRLSADLRAMIERGHEVRAVDYNCALERIPALNAALAGLFAEHDAILTPAAPGAAPHGLGATGSPVFCTLWTLCGTPAVSLPLLRSAAGLPLGVQLVGRQGDDAGLLRTARWLLETCRTAG